MPSAHVDLFSLRSARDLFAKLEHDHQRLSSALGKREAQFAAFDFFVTAHHLADWLAVERKSNAATLRIYADGDLVSHIANGAKHFELSATRHTSLARAGVTSGAFQSGVFQSSAFQVGGSLFIETTYGVTEGVATVAARVLEHWRKVVGNAT